MNKSHDYPLPWGLPTEQTPQLPAGHVFLFSLTDGLIHKFPSNKQPWFEIWIWELKKVYPVSINPWYILWNPSVWCWTTNSHEINPHGFTCFTSIPVEFPDCWSPCEFPSNTLQIYASTLFAIDLERFVSTQIGFFYSLQLSICRVYPLVN